MSSHASTYTFLHRLAIYYDAPHVATIAELVPLMLQALWSWCRTCCYCWLLHVLLHASPLLQMQTEHPQSKSR